MLIIEIAFFSELCVITIGMSQCVQMDLKMAMECVVSLDFSLFVYLRLIFSLFLFIYYVLEHTCRTEPNCKLSIFERIFFHSKPDLLNFFNDSLNLIRFDHSLLNCQNHYLNSITLDATGWLNETIAPNYFC